MYDVEVSPNYMLVGVELPNGKVKQFSAFGSNVSLCEKDVNKLRKLINEYQFVGFNSIKYDDPITTYMLSGEPCDGVYQLSKALIEEGLAHWDAYAEIGRDAVHSMDIIEVAPQSASLKAYGSRLFTKKIQDLPYSPHQNLSKKQTKKMAEYNKVDLTVTRELYTALIDQLDIRQDIGDKYQINVMSRSDAQIAEDVFKKALGFTKKPKIDRPSFVEYKAPSYVKFKSKNLRKLLEDFESTLYKINRDTGKFIAHDWMKEKIVVGGVDYTIGIGGLHSNEKALVHKGDIKNADIASMYPSLIINSGKFPIQMGKNWLALYTQFRDDRMKIKHTDKKLSAVLKIFLNGTYGKLNSPYSILYAPHLMLDTTITGQLSLLMVVEALTNAGITVLSANTDGVEYVDSTKKGQKIIDKLGKKMNLVWEHAGYNALYARDVNNYIAVYDDDVKSKGAYGEPTLSKNSEYPIVFEAIRQFLFTGKPMSITLEECADPVQFTSVRAVTGGGIWGDDKDIPNTEEFTTYTLERKTINRKQNKALEKRNDKFRQELVLASDDIKYLGKTVRWYYAKDGSPIYYKKSGNQVPKTQGCKPMMNIKKKFPKDLDMT